MVSSSLLNPISFAKTPRRLKLREQKIIGFNRDDETIEEMEIAYTSLVGYVFPLP
jgi:hypothetical protein